MDIVTLALAKKYADSINSGITNITTENNKLIFTLQNGNTIEVPLTDLVNNVVTEEELLNKLKDYIKNTDWASFNKGGIIKISDNYGTNLYNGALFATTKKYNEYEKSPVSLFVGKGTLENVIEGKNLETANNKVTFVDKDSTDTEYPSAKVMYKVSNKLDTLKDEVLDTGEASDSFIHIEDSAISELQELEVEGVCEQKATEGYNILNTNNLVSSTTNGITYTPVYKENGTLAYINVNGTATDNSTYTVHEGTRYPVNKDKSYLISGCPTGGSSSTYSILTYTYNEENTYLGGFYDNGSGVIVSQASFVWLHIDIKKGVTLNNAKFYPMLVVGNEKKDYEPYTGGIASPNPEYPQEIKTIENGLKITSCNKNIFINELLTTETTMNGVTITPISDTIFKLNGTATSTTYFNLRREKVFGAFILRDVESSIKSQTVNGYTLSASISNGVTNVGHNANNGLWSINIASGAVYNNAILKIQLQSQINANLPEGEFIGKLNDTYKDTLKVEYNEEDGKYHLILNKNISKKIFDANDDWSRSANNNGNTFRFSIGNAEYIKDGNYETESPNFKSNYFQSNSFSNIYLKDQSGISWWFNDTKTNWVLSFGNNISLEDFKTFLTEHIIMAYYATTKPYTIDLGPVEMPLSYNEITNIFTDSDLLPKINATYYRNFKQTIKNINSDISSIKSNYVKNTDFATSTTAGVITLNDYFGVYAASKGQLVGSTKSYSAYTSGENRILISKGTLENVITGKNLETANNKVTSLGTGSTDIEYPSAKCTYKIKEDLDNLKSDILEKGEVSDSCIHVEDSIKNELLKLKVDGVCEQKTTTGKNKLPNNATSQTINGIAYIVNSDGSVYAKGTATARSEFTIYYDKPFTLNANTEYKFQTDILMILQTSTGYISGTKGKILTSESEISVLKVYIRIENGNSIDKIIYPMITLSNQNDTYEPFTGGQPSPNPDYPQEIKTITDSLSVTSCNKNLFDGLLELGIYNNSTGEKESSIVSIRSVNYISVKPNTSYTVLEENNKSIYFHEYDKNKIFISTNALLNTPKTITTSANTNYLTINTRGSEDVTDINTKIIIVEGTTVTSFEEHIQSQITANLGNEFIGKIDDTYKDTLSVDLQADGKYHLMLNKIIKKLSLNTVDIFDSYVQSNGVRIFRFKLKPIGNCYAVMCKYFISTPNRFQNYYNIEIACSKFNTITDFKNFAVTNNVEIYYVLETPYTVDLGPIEMPLTYNEVTNIFTDSDLLPRINAKYYKNFITTIRNLQVNNDTLKNELVSIKNRLTTLENANTSVVSESEVADDIQEQ